VLANANQNRKVKKREEERGKKALGEGRRQKAEGKEFRSLGVIEFRSLKVQ